MPEKNRSKDSVVTSNYTVEFATRIQEIRALVKSDPAEAKKLAKEAKITDATAKTNWNDTSVQIAIAEFEEKGKRIYEEGYSPAEIAAQSSTVEDYTDPSDVKYQSWGQRARTGKSGDKIRTNSAGGLVDRG